MPLAAFKKALMLLLMASRCKQQSGGTGVLQHTSLLHAVLHPCVAAILLLSSAATGSDFNATLVMVRRLHCRMRPPITRVPCVCRPLWLHHRH